MVTLVTKLFKIDELTNALVSGGVPLPVARPADTSTLLVEIKTIKDRSITTDSKIAVGFLNFEFFKLMNPRS